MLDLEYLGEVSMEIIAYAGVAKSKYIEAIKKARLYQFDEGMQLISEGDEMMHTVHDTHLKLLQKEAAENVAQSSLLVMHAEDQLMNSETIKLMALEMIEVYKQIQEMKGGI